MLQVMFVLLLHVQVFIVCLWYYKTVVSMIDEFRYPAVVCAKVYRTVHTSGHTTCTRSLTWHSRVVKPDVGTLFQTLTQAEFIPYQDRYIFEIFTQMHQVIKI